MDSLQLLKQEINTSTDAVHDLVKWKLIVTSALAAAAFGLTTIGHPYYPLALLIPYACAYVDLNSYQHLIRIAVIARFLREQDGDEYLQNYERQCEALRTNNSGVFNLTIYGQLWSSLGLSIFAPIWALVSFVFASSQESSGALFHIPKVLLAVFAVLWVFGVALVYAVFLYYQEKNSLADEC